MRHRIPPAILSAAAGLVLMWHAGSDAQPRLATGPDADVTEDGLHRVDPLVMEAAWVKPDLDLSSYTRILLVPTAVHFREVADSSDPFSRTRSGVTEFPLNAERKRWLREVWSRVIEEAFSRDDTYELYTGAGSDVLIVQGLLADVVSHVPTDTAVSNYTWVRDPWVANVVLEVRDGATGELLARTIDRRTGEGLMEANTVWMLTEDLLERWAQVLTDRLEQLSDLSEPDRRTLPSGR